MLGQYSVPFSLAVAAWRDPEDPAAFAADCVDDSAVLDLAARIELETGDSPGWRATQYPRRRWIPRSPGQARR